MIKLDNITKVYGDFQALSGISFSLSKGEIVSFLGPNGAGKTTTIRIITNFFPASSGMVSIKGQMPVYGRQFIGYMPESNPLYPNFFVEDYFRYVLHLRNMEDRGDISRVVKKCALRSVMSKKIGELSKGYRQRVGLAASIIHDPEILILDEPTIGLDPNQIVGIRDLIKELGREKTVMISTHILSEAEALATRMIIIDRGEIALDSPAENIGEAFSPQIVLKLSSIPEGIDKIKGIPGVEKTETAGNEIRIYYSQNSDIRGEVFRLCAHEKWDVLEIFREKMGLAEVFKNLTGSRPHAVVPAAAPDEGHHKGAPDVQD